MQPLAPVKRHAAPKALFGLLLAGGLGQACGSKSGLLSNESPGPASGGTTSGFGGSGASAGSSGAGGVGGGVADAGPDAEPPLPDCVYAQHGEPILLFTYPEGVYTPTLARVSPGSAGEPARVAVGLIHEHFWHPELRVAEISVTPEWPDGVSVTHPMLLYGIDAHAPGQMIPAVSGGSGLALLYFHADEANPNVIPGVKFRRFDTAAWKPFDEVFIEQLAGYAYSIAAGPALGPGNQWSGLGYGVTWRSQASGDAGSFVTTARAAVIDELGKIVAGPVDVAAPGAYPGIGATLSFSGETYLIANNARPCPAESPECANRLTLARLEPGAGPQAKLVETGSVPPMPGRRARTPLIRSFAGASWVSWREQDIETTPGQVPPSTLRLVGVTANGQLTANLWQTEAQPEAGAELLASDQGVVLVWGERVDKTLQPHQSGHSHLRFVQFSKSGQQLQELELPTTELTTGTAYSVTTLTEPRALLVSFTAQEQKAGGHAAAYLARFDCVDPIDGP